MAQVTTGYVELDEGKLYYERGGEGPTLVLVHAGFVDSRMWDSQWEAFTQHYDVIRFDMRGFGRSDPATGPVSRRQELYRLLLHLQVERAFLLGCSMGGATIIDLALEHSEMVAALIVVSTAPGGFELQGEPPPHLFEMIAALEAGDVERASELQIRIWVDGLFRQPEQVNPLVRQRAAEMNRIAVANRTPVVADAAPLDPLVPPAVGRLHELRLPVLVMAGALDHPEILRATDVMAAGVKDAHKVILPDSAHLPNMERPEEFNQAVLQFLNGLE